MQEFFDRHLIKNILFSKTVKVVKNMNHPPTLNSLGNLRDAFENARQSSAVETVVQESVAASAHMANVVITSKLQKYGMIFVMLILFTAYVVHRRYSGSVKQLVGDVDGLGEDIKSKVKEVEEIGRRIDELDLHQGPQGEPGPKGAKGDKGDTGDDGVCPEDCKGIEGGGAVDGMMLNYGAIKDLDAQYICLRDNIGSDFKSKPFDTTKDCDGEDEIKITYKDYMRQNNGIRIGEAETGSFMWGTSAGRNQFYNNSVKINIPDYKNDDFINNDYDNTDYDNLYRNYNLLVGGPAGTISGPFTIDKGYSIGFTSEHAIHDSNDNDKDINNFKSAANNIYRGFINTTTEGTVQLQGCHYDEDDVNCQAAESTFVDLRKDGLFVRNSQRDGNKKARICVSNEDVSYLDRDHLNDIVPALCLDATNGLCMGDKGDECISIDNLKTLTSKGFQSLLKVVHDNKDGSHFLVEDNTLKFRQEEVKVDLDDAKPDDAQVN